MNRDQFSRFEERIEQLVEGSFARLFGSRLHPREVAIKLAHAVEDNVQEGRNHQLQCPSRFSVYLNPDDLDALMKHQPELPRLLAETVVDLANRAELRLDTVPVVDVRPDETMALHDVRVVANYSEEQRSTQVLEALPAQTPLPEPKPRNPQLILNGNKYIALERNIINIGRKRDNHVVIDDARVSRVHAQIRLRFGRFVIYDLGSTGGTYVNNHRITEAILHPGDVISVAGIPLVYVEDDALNRGALLSDTQMRPPGNDPHGL